MRGRKQELELIMMYYLLHDIETDDEYWNEYLEKLNLFLAKTGVASAKIKEL